MRSRGGKIKGGSWTRGQKNGIQNKKKEMKQIVR